MKLTQIMLGIGLSCILSFSAKGMSSNPKQTDQITAAPNNNDQSTVLHQRELEQFTNSVINYARKQLQIPGVVVSIVKDGDILLSKGYGLADVKNNIPVDPNHTQFAVASISKTFTYTAIMQLVERGEITLDDQVSDILQLRSLDQGKDPITIRQLLTHSAGFEDSYFGQTYATSEASDPTLMQYIKQSMPARVRPNDQYIVYSNYGTALAGAVIEKVSKIPFEQYMKTNLLSPLGMSRSVFGDSKIPLKGDSNRAVGHLWTGGRYTDSRDYYHHHGEYPLSGLKSTASDMAQFMLFHLSKGKNTDNKILQAETMVKMHNVIKRNHPKTAGNAHGFWSENIYGYSSLSHSGNTKGFKSDMVLIPELGLGVFISTNSVSGDRLTAEFTPQLIQAFFPTASAGSENSVIAIDNESQALNQELDLNQYSGSYLTMRRNYSTIERMTASPIYIGAQEKSLTVYLGAKSFNLIPQGNHVFLDETSGNEIAFEIDENGKAILFRDADVLERIGRWEDPTKLMDIIFVIVILSGLILLFAFTRWINKTPQTQVEKNFASVLSLSAALWLVFYTCLSTTIATFQNQILPPIFLNFPDTPTQIGQWVLIMIVLCVLVLLYWLIQLWKTGGWHWLARTCCSLYLALFSFTLYWSTEFNLIGFQY